MSLSSGTRLGHYEIVALLGAGGMGEVYKAKDPRLNRTVAVKILLQQISERHDARARFEREAQTIAGLNHPNICVVYDVGRRDATDYLVMELLEGETLAHRLERGPLPLHVALQYATQIADALDKAHRHGVTHRDLKPGNIMITRSGVKLLDFGLAKLRESPIVSNLSAAPTNAEITAEGTILGSLHYMAPEQLEGGEADARTDIFAFGAVVYEMVAGRKAFDGKSAVSVMGAILKDTPQPLSALQPIAPAALDRLVSTCMAKDPEDRWQTARDVWHGLIWIAESASNPESGKTPAGAGAVGRRGIPGGAVAAIVAGAVLITAATTWMLMPSAGPSRTGGVVRLNVTVPQEEQLDVSRPAVAVSPDGRKVVYVGVRGSASRLYLRNLDELEAKPIAGTEGASSPFFSPNGEWIGFFAQGQLKKVSVAGGASQVLAPAPSGMGGSWSSEDTVYYAPNNLAGIWKVSASAGKAEQVTTLDRAKGEVSHRWPQILPGGEAVVFTVWTGPGSDEHHTHLQILASGERRVLVPGGDTGRYISTGHLLYARDASLMVVPFDLANLKVAGGTPIPLLEEVNTIEGAQHAVSDSGVLAYLAGHATRERLLVWLNRTSGRAEALPAPPRAYEDSSLSPDGRYIASTVRGGTWGVWIYDITRNVSTLLATPGSSQWPEWTADGSRIIYRGTRNGFRNLYWKAADGSGDEERLTTSENLQTANSAVPGWLAFQETDPTTGADIWVIPLDKERKPQPFLNSVSSEDQARLSPNGRWIAYNSNESGQSEVYVRPFPGPGARLPISTDGGTRPVWSRNGKELFYANGRKLMVVEINDTQAALAATSSRLLFEVGDEIDIGDFDVSLDGQRFLAIQSAAPENPATQINVVLNWFEELKGATPTGR